MISSFFIGLVQCYDTSVFRIDTISDNLGVNKFGAAQKQTPLAVFLNLFL